MREEQIKKLKHIKNKITVGGYSTLRQNEWDSFAEDLSNCGVTLLKDIEQKRDEVREFNISYFFFFGLRKLNKLNSSYDKIIKNYDLFFDASMRWLSSIINGNKYEEYQILKRENVEKLVDHCRQTVDYLGNIISSRRKDYYYYQALSLSVVAIIIALISLVIR